MQVFRFCCISLFFRLHDGASQPGLNYGIALPTWWALVYVPVYSHMGAPAPWQGPELLLHICCSVKGSMQTILLALQQDDNVTLSDWIIICTLHGAVAVCLGPKQ